jgi:hypothetical protein
MKYFAALGIALLVIAAASVGPWAPSPFTSQTGTNTTAAAWRTALGAAASSTLSGYVTNHTGAATNLALTGGSVTTQTNTDLTASRVVVSSASKVLASSSVTSTTLGYLDATSSVQTQLDSKPTVALTNLALLNGTNTFSGTNTFTKSLFVVTPNSGNVQLSLSQGSAGYTFGRNAATGNLDIVGDGAYSINFNGGAIFSSAITIGGNSVLANNSSSVVFTDLRLSNADFRLGNTSANLGYIIARDSVTGFLHFNAQQGAYTGFFFHTGNASNALAVTQSGKIGAGTAAPSSALHVVGTGLTVGSAGTAVTNYASATATLNFGSILAAGYEDLTITVTGAAVNDTVTLGLPATVLAGAVFNAWVSSANTVTVRCNNAGSIAVDPASATYRVGVTSH